MTDKTSQSNKAQTDTLQATNARANAIHILSDEVRANIDRWIARYPADQKRSGVLEALRFAQNANNGYLTTEIMDAVADYLGMQRIAVYEVVSFYTLYNTAPVGKHILNLCTNISCMLSNSDKIMQHLKNRLNIDINETTPDKKFTLRQVECLGACANAPVIHVGTKYYENLTPEKVDALLDELE
ncbi:MAG: NAD(P)H-dependent oxidoreductase subunit E [Gammaproteobacteria bacterium]|nr:NAD(P)H-dependent oxidoreductase subunit E [Gammaproteobacteria bacterium]